ncbi:MAG: hypothetical protein ACI4A3_05320 [Lachnospiraceae bacterium]
MISRKRTICKDGTKAEEISLQNPRVENGVSIYDHVYFGSYPQAEVIPSLSEDEKTTVGPNIRNGNDYVVDELNRM